MQTIDVDAADVTVDLCQPQTYLILQYYIMATRDMMLRKNLNSPADCYFFPNHSIPYLHIH